MSPSTILATDVASHSSAGRYFGVGVSYMRIENDSNVVDLLRPSSGKNLRIVEDKDRGATNVVGLTEKELHSPVDIYDILRRFCMRHSLSLSFSPATHFCCCRRRYTPKQPSTPNASSSSSAAGGAASGTVTPREEKANKHSTILTVTLNLASRPRSGEAAVHFVHVWSSPHTQILHDAGRYTGSSLEFDTGNNRVSPVASRTLSRVMEPASGYPVAYSETFRLSFVELPSSELSHTAKNPSSNKNTGQVVSKTLNALSTVLSSLRRTEVGGHVPYRDSKLTHVLKEWFVSFLFLAFFLVPFFSISFSNSPRLFTASTPTAWLCLSLRCIATSSTSQRL